MSEPTDITQQVLQNIQAGIADIKGDVREIRADLAEIKSRVARLETTADETAMAVANLAVSNRHLRADVSKVLANQDNHEARIKRIEEHLGLAKA